MDWLKTFWSDERGATSIEYAVIGALLSILIILGATAIGTKLNSKLTPIATGLS